MKLTPGVDFIHIFDCNLEPEQINLFCCPLYSCSLEVFSKCTSLFGYGLKLWVKNVYEIDTCG
jgi:hypothetical protein